MSKKICVCITAFVRLYLRLCVCNRNLKVCFSLGVRLGDMTILDREELECVDELPKQRNRSIVSEAHSVNCCSMLLDRVLGILFYSADSHCFLVRFMPALETRRSTNHSKLQVVTWIFHFLPSLIRIEAVNHGCLSIFYFLS